MRREEIDAVFGVGATGHALFYRHERALRFSLARGEDKVTRFTTAFDRGQQILDAAFDGTERMVLVVTDCDPESVAPKRLLRALQDLGLEVSRPYHQWSTVVDSEENLRTRFLSFEIPVAHRDRALFGAVATELGISPRLPGDAYLLAPELGVLAHPYDDRGMDVLGPNHRRLRTLYDTLSPMLLEYDRAAMDVGIGAWTPEERAEQ